MDKETFIQRAADLAPSYQPNPQVKARLAKVDLVAIVGPTGVGKTTLMLKSGLPFVLTDVTRSPREGEKDGTDYNFRSDYDKLLAEVQNGEFAQFLVGHTGEFYGTKIRSYPEEGPCTMAIIASAIPVFRSLGFRRVLAVYVLPPTYQEWMRRAGAHPDADLHKRLIEARESLGMALNDPDYTFLLNDNLAAATAQLKTIIDGTAKPYLQAQAIARGLYNKLSSMNL